MKVYVIHCLDLIERKQNVERQLREKGLDGDVEWITDFPRDGPVVK